MRINAALRSFVFDVGQECRHHSDERQIGADSVHEFDAVSIRKSAQDGGADAPDAKGESKKESRHGTDIAGHQFLREYDDGREG